MNTVSAQTLAQSSSSGGLIASTRFIIADGTLEALKWLALILMLADHINKYFYAEALPGVFQIGRIVMPIFGFVLVYNLTRPSALQRSVHGRLMVRLALVGLLSVPACIALNEELVSHYAWWPFNIFSTLLLVTAIIFLVEKGGVPRHLLAIAIFVVAGAFVEYLWMGVLACLGAWAFCRDASFKGCLLWFLGTLTLTAINANAWALLSIPIVLIASRVDMKLPRSKWVFYGFYPVHLLVLAAFKA